MNRVATFDPTAPAGVFTSRWWGIVSTVYMLAAPVTLLMGIVGTIASVFDESNSPRPVLYQTPVFLLVCFLGPLILGFVVATAIEFKRKAEPPLSGGRKLRRSLRIALGFLLPFLAVYVFLRPILVS